MKVIYRLMAIAGALCLLSAAGNADAYGASYPLDRMALWVGVGLVLIGTALTIRKKIHKED